MSDLNTVAPQQLYRQWRGGDAASGQAMAQRFSDWYYAVTACRLGDQHGRTPLQRACTRFQQGIVSVTNPNDLADWAHGILSEELRMAGGRIPGGDFANALTRGRLPSEILARARAAMPAAQVRLLAHAYDARYPFDRVAKEAEALGGMPFAVLDARYALKRWLRKDGVTFSETPENPNLDYAPLPLYEAGRMSNASEEDGFEKWMLQNMSLCTDIAEFGVFALSLRNGAFAQQREAAAAGAAPVIPAVVPAPAATPVTAPVAGPALGASAPSSRRSVAPARGVVAREKAPVSAANASQTERAPLVLIAVLAVVGVGALAFAAVQMFGIFNG
jgi:hypothetical protein